MLSDIDIRQNLGGNIQIFTEHKDGEFSFNPDKQIQPGSIDLRFRNDFKRFKSNYKGNLTREALVNNDYTTPFSLSNSEKLVIQPREIILTTTLETVIISKDYAGLITGRSSIARLGVMVQCCQDFVNPGNGQAIGLQLINLSPFPVELDLRVPICQLILFRLGTSASISYVEMKDAKYAGEGSPRTSLIHTEYADDKTRGNIADNFFKGSKQALNRYVAPFLPPLIMLLIITPLISSVNDFSISSVISAIAAIPIVYIVALIAVVLYLWLRKGKH